MPLASARPALAFHSFPSLLVPVAWPDLPPPAAPMQTCGGEPPAPRADSHTAAAQSLLTVRMSLRKQEQETWPVTATSKSHQKASGSHWGLMTQRHPTAPSELHALKQSRRHSADVAKQVHPCLGGRRLSRAAGSCSRGPQPPHSSVQGHLHPVARGLGHLCNLTVLRWQDFETNMRG